MDARGAQTRQIGIAMMATVDLEDDRRLAIASVGQNAELAGTTETAVAVGQSEAVDFPGCLVMLFREVAMPDAPPAPSALPV